MWTETFDGYTICIGSDKNENDGLVRGAQANDIWVHLSDYCSPHGLISNPSGKKVSLKAIKRACCLVKARSKCKALDKVECDVAYAKSVTATDVKGEVTVGKLIKNIFI
jgi:predicted ribosome quality control (RQC) complex YloA/Tae2 family protein